MLTKQLSILIDKFKRELASGKVQHFVRIYFLYELNDSSVCSVTLLIFFLLFPQLYWIGAGLSFLAGGVFGWTFGQEIANHTLQLYRLDTLAAQVKFMEWWEKKSEGQSWGGLPSNCTNFVYFAKIRKI